MNCNEIDVSTLPSPCYIIDCDILNNKLLTFKENCAHLGVRALISIKGFPLALLYKDMAPYVYGLSASSLFEARLGKHMGNEIHIHAPAYKNEEILDVFAECDYVNFNSLSQWKQYKNLLPKNTNCPQIGLRINPEYAEIDIEKYNTCLPHSRFGITQKALLNQDISGIDGFHLHVMCDNNADTFARVIDHVIDKFGIYLKQLKWINLGGGQCLADENYVTTSLQKNISKLKNDFNLEVYVEPCEAVVTESGYLVSTVLDVVNNQKQTAILDTSALCHMPDVLEMPYRPDITFPAIGNNVKHNYILAGISCLAGDIIGEYRFNSAIHTGDKIVFSDMGAYTFSKQSYFNGINQPSIVLYDKIHGFRIVKQFDYFDYEYNYI